MTPPEDHSEQKPSLDGPSVERPSTGWRARLGRGLDRVGSMPGVRTILAVNAAYNEAGGSLLASGLAFSALFAVIPGLLFVVTLLVIVLDDPAARSRVIEWIVDQVPPLRDVATAVVTNLATDARVGSLVGLALFLWGASSFYLGLDSAIDRTIPGGRPENPWLARLQGVIAVALLVFAALAGFVISGLASVMSLGGWAPVLSPLAAIAIATGLCLVVYLLLPNDRPSAREAGPAALVAGIGIGLLTSFFGALAPLLVQGFVALGVIASVFVALVWFSWTFQILLLGASFARLRRDANRSATTDAAALRASGGDVSRLAPGHG